MSSGIEKNVNKTFWFLMAPCEKSQGNFWGFKEILTAIWFQFKHSCHFHGTIPKLLELKKYDCGWQKRMIVTFENRTQPHGAVKPSEKLLTKWIYLRIYGQRWRYFARKSSCWKPVCWKWKKSWMIFRNVPSDTFRRLTFRERTMWFENNIVVQLYR